MGIAGSHRREQPMRCRPKHAVPKCFREVECPFQKAHTAYGTHGAIHYSLVGPEDGEVLVCFHGLNGSRMLFGSTAEILSNEGFRVLAFDLYGHGLSNAPKVDLSPCQACGTPTCGAPRGRYSLDFFVHQCDELLHAVGLGDRPVSLLGLCLGGSVAVAFARAFPERVRKMCIISPSGFMQKLPRAYYLLQALWCCLIPLAPHVLCTCIYKRERFMSQLRREDSDMDEADAEHLWRKFVWQLFVKRGVASAVLAMLHRVPWDNQRQLFEEVGKHPRPVLVLWGDRDALQPLVPTAEDVRQLFCNAQLMVAKNSGHICIYDQPVQVISAIAAFMHLPADAQLATQPVVPTLRLARGGSRSPSSPSGSPDHFDSDRAAQMPIPLVLGHTDISRSDAERTQGTGSTDTGPQSPAESDEEVITLGSTFQI